MMNLLNNQNGHGQVPDGKVVLKVIGLIITAPLWLPFKIIRDKLKKKKEK